MIWEGLAVPLILNSIKATTNPQSGALQIIVNYDQQHFSSWFLTKPKGTIYKHDHTINPISWQHPLWWFKALWNMMSFFGRVCFLPHTNYPLELFFHWTNHVAVKIIFWCEVVVLPWIRIKKMCKQVPS